MYKIPYIYYLETALVHPRCREIKVEEQKIAFSPIQDGGKSKRSP